MKNSFRIHNRARVPLTLGTIWTVAFALMYTCTIHWDEFLSELFESTFLSDFYLASRISLIDISTNLITKFAKKNERNFQSMIFINLFGVIKGMHRHKLNDFIWINRIFNLLLFNYVFNGEIHCLLLITAPATRSPFWSDIMLEDDWRRLINIEPTVIWPIANKCSISPPID